MPTTYLDLTDLDDLIRNFETKWGISTMEMLKEPPARKQIPENEILRWETYIRQRRQLRECYAELRSRYLSHIPKSHSNKLPPKEQSELAVAA